MSGPNPADADFYLTTREAATLLRVSPESIIRWILRGQLQAVRRRPPGGGPCRYLIPREAVYARLEQVVPRPVPAVALRPMNAETRRILVEHGLLKYCRGHENHPLTLQAEEEKQRALEERKRARQAERDRMRGERNRARGRKKS